MAKKLIDTKSVISYDAQVKHSINQARYRHMIAKVNSKRNLLNQSYDSHRSTSSFRARANASPSSIKSRKSSKFTRNRINM